MAGIEVSVLYPRLLDRVAGGLFEGFADVRDGSTLAPRATTKHPGAVFAATGGRRVTTDELTQLRSSVLDLARTSGYPRPAGPSARGDFDTAVARLLHESMGVVAAEASVRAMWAFLSLVLFPDVTYWRFPTPPRDRVLATDITRHVFGRLWWRAHLLHDSAAADPYWLLGTFREAAFDQIFARRRALGGSRTVIRTLATAWNTFDLGEHPERDVLRETLKRLLRLGAFQEFESLDPDVARAELEVVVREAVRGLSA